MRLVDINYNLESYWPIESSDDRLSNNKLTCKLVENIIFKTNHNQENCKFFNDFSSYMFI